MSTDDPKPNPDALPPENGLPQNEEGGDAAQLDKEVADAGEGTVQKRSRLKRGIGWLKENRFQAAIAGLILLLGLVSGITLSILGAGESSQARIQKGMKALGSGGLTKAKKIATIMATDSDEAERGPAEAAFILGMIAADDAEADGPKGESSYALAARYFDVAYPDGFPKEFKFEGLKTYGKVLLKCNRFAKSRQILEQALNAAQDTSEKNEARYLFVENELESESTDLTEAARQNQAYLDTKELTELQRTDALLQKLQIESRQGKFESARKTLALLPKTPAYSERVYYAKGRLAMSEAEAELTEGQEVSKKAKAKLDEAIDSFRRSQGHASESSLIVPKAQYLIAVCLEKLGEDQAAIRQWDQVCKFFPDSPEAVASQYRLSGMYFREEANEETPTEAIRYFRQVTKVLEKPAYVNPWFTKVEVREDADRRILAFRKDGKLEAALAMAKAISPLISKPQAMRLLASLNKELGQQILDKLQPNLGGKEQELKRRQARRHFREASLLFANLVKQEKTSPLYSEDLWESAQCALNGNDFIGAVKAFTDYLNTEPEKRNSTALLGLGEAYLALGQIDEAIDTFEQCIEFYPTDVATFRARLLAAGAWQEKGDPKSAERLLLENWSAAGITPKSLVWRETVYRLGALYHDTKRYDKAIERLADAVRRFPDDPRNNLAQYLLADSYRLRAGEEQLRIEKTMTRSKLSAQKANIKSDLDNAYQQYVSLQQKIGAQRGMGELCEMDDLLLRNSRLFAAGVLFQLEEYKQAIKAYSTVSLHYQGQPIAIQAMKQNAQALSDIGENNKARFLIRRAINQLEKMGPDLPYEETTLYSYDEWMDRFQQMEKEIALKQQITGT